MLCQGIGAHGRQYQLAKRADGRNKQGVEKVTGQRHPGILQKDKQIDKVLKGRIARE